MMSGLRIMHHEGNMKLCSVYVFSMLAFLTVFNSFCVNAVQAAEASDYDYVYDNAGLFDDTHAMQLEGVMQGIRREYGVKVYMVTEEHVDKSSSVGFARSIIFPRDHDGIFIDENDKEVLNIIILYGVSSETVQFVQMKKKCGIPVSKLIDVFKEQRKTIEGGDYYEAFSRILEFIKAETGSLIYFGNYCEIDSEHKTPETNTCDTYWKTGKYDDRGVQKMDYCDIFEVANPALIPIVKEAESCCRNGCKGECHEVCMKAYKESGLSENKGELTMKKCKGLYLIYGLGPAKRWIRGYYDETLSCSGSNKPVEGKVKTDDTPDICYHEGAENTKDMVCRTFDLSIDKPVPAQMWVSDTDMSKNSCHSLFMELPASVSLLYLKTGICANYAYSLTTLLRIAGYTRSEVLYAVNSNKGHAYNLVKFPGDSMYHIVSTNGNWNQPYVRKKLPSTFQPYCGYDVCKNDGGKMDCPPKSMVYGCEDYTS